MAAGALVAGAIDPGDEAQVPEEAGHEPLDDAATTIRGAAANDSAGWTVASVGDVDGDNRTDLAVGAPGNDTGGTEAGATYLFYGPVAPGTGLSDADAVLVGESAGDEAGTAVAGAGDLNDDGADEVLVGAPLHGDADGGAAYVVYGGDERLAGTVDLGTAEVVLEGTAGDRAGWAVAGGADAAGVPGVIVGAPRYDSGEGPDGRDVGVAALVTNETLDRARTAVPEGTADGADSPATLSIPVEADASLVGESDGDLAGWAVDTGDVNDDGVADVVVGARKHNLTGDGDDGSAASDPDAGDDGTNAGGAYVVHGPVAGTTDLSTADLRLRGGDGGDQAGYAVASGTDVDGDGVDDVVAGAPFHNPTEDRQNAGTVYVISGGANQSGERSLAAANATLSGGGVGHRAGWAVATGNGTCDGVGDVLVGAPRLGDSGNQTGGVALVAGGADLEGTTDLAAANRTESGASPGDQAGHAVALPGDLNGDEAPEIAVGAPGSAGATGPNAGAVAVHYGECPDEQRAAETPQPGAADEAPAAPATGTATPADTEEPLQTDAGTETPTDAGTETRTDAETPTQTEPAPTETATPEPTETATPGATETATDTVTGTATETSTETATETSTTTATETETEAPDSVAASSLEVEISCERDQPYVYNPNDVGVTVTIDGPDGTTTEEVGPEQDVGGPSAPSLNGDSLPAGEYTVTASAENGDPAPVNGGSSWSTTVKECPSTTVETRCIDGNTAQVSVSAENLEGRHANPVEIQVQSPDESNREQSGSFPPASGVVEATLSLDDGSASTVSIDLADYQPSLLATLTVEPGACADQGGEASEETSQEAAAGASDGGGGGTESGQ